MTSGSDVIQSSLDIYFPQLLGEIDARRLAAAKKIIDGGTYKVHKSPRSGFSTSAIMAAVKSGKWTEPLIVDR